MSKVSIQISEENERTKGKGKDNESKKTIMLKKKYSACGGSRKTW